MGNWKKCKLINRNVINTNINLIIRRKKTTLYLDTPKNTSVLELKKMIEGKTSITRNV